ncbi:hypothetical protein E2C01_062170 [Portunus trituberculatus]|uniref:DUF7869 domain-containing protein n=1 Tax=Portunus trituberculatus TaxID=210409 RepID=A0A5B7H5R4_PORTR|nr:hypothetical protein [Portunus trituberculatus]
MGPRESNFGTVAGLHETVTWRVHKTVTWKGRRGGGERDMRRRHMPVNKVTDQTREWVKKHICLLPTMSSHYTRAKAPVRKYLESHLTIRSIYDVYLEWMTVNYQGEEQVSFHFYNDMFTKNFNISFEPPKMDTCTTCDTLDNKIACSTYSLPQYRSGTAYYKRKLWTYNFCVHDLKKKISTMYVWYETQAKRGSIEVASCIKKWVDEEKGKFDKLVVVSDNCAGRNKNINLVLYYLRELNVSRLVSIDHFYLISGQSYMDCDQAFGVIEKKIRRTGNVYTPDYCNLNHTSVANNYPVVRMKQEDFLDFSVL